jgi:SWI/SNF-related matrix-associated actin-dependent regulator of chromatin subfamily A3
VVISDSKESEDPLETQYNFTTSTKIQALLTDLKNVRSKTPVDEPPIKSVVFSQWTKMLDTIEPVLKSEGFKVVRLDGRMRRIDRAIAIDKFKKDPKVLVMLISLRAGGVGLNLTAASRIYLLEPYWNPAVEQQAVDRVHRLGQTRPVQTIRFIAKGTIEENMVALQQKKMELARMTFNEKDETEAMSSKAQKQALMEERLAELKNLFR